MRRVLDHSNPSMKVVAVLAAALGTASTALPGPDEPPRSKAEVEAPANLIPNGDFEKGMITPEGWQTVDGLTSFWVEDQDKSRGRVIKFDTDVLQSQGYDWWAKIAAGASPKDAPPKLPTVEPKYDTLAGLDGVWFWSDYIPIERDKAYWLTLDVKGPPLLVWLVGYPEKGSVAFGSEAGAFQEARKMRETGKPPTFTRDRQPFIHKYVWKGQLAAGGADAWKTYSRREKPFRPTAVTPKVRFVRVLIFPFWPPAEYRIDNVRLVEVEEKGRDRGPK